MPNAVMRVAQNTASISASPAASGSALITDRLVGIIRCRMSARWRSRLSAGVAVATMLMNKECHCVIYRRRYWFERLNWRGVALLSLALIGLLWCGYWAGYWLGHLVW
jgi:hypothetical protein